MMHVVLDGRRRDPKFLRDTPVGIAEGDQRRHFALPGAEHRERGAPVESRSWLHDHDGGAELT